MRHCRAITICRRSPGALVLIASLALTGCSSGSDQVAEPQRPPAATPIRFSDVADLPGSGIGYRRTPSRSEALWDPLRAEPTITMFDFGGRAPLRSRGAPGVALWDYDKDGDVDIYVTNGPGTPNSLYSNQRVESGSVRFIDVAESAGVAAAAMDSTGVCYGDTDNDGDHDLYVVGAGEHKKLFVNNSNGTFTDVSGNSAVAGRATYSAGCSMGDVNGDGLLDIAIANTLATWDRPFEPTDHNELLINIGNNRFEDRSDTSGIMQLAGFPAAQAGSASLAWAIAMVDYDQDGDVDIVTADDQSAYGVGGGGGVPGYIHIHQNDGAGNFRDVAVEAGTNIAGAWMGLSFGDLNSDGHLDMFVTNIGDYMNSEYFPYSIGDLATTWFLGQPDSTFTTPRIDEARATFFGWGTVMLDYDNDADTDIVYRGGMDGGPLIDVSNPGIVLVNDGSGALTVDTAPLGSAGHDRRDVYGLAKGDLNNDGFVDLVSVSDFDIPQSVPLTRYTRQWGAGLDQHAYFVRSFNPVGPGQFSWAGYQFDNGTLSIDINSASNANGAVSIDLLGTVGITQGGRSNRDGIGAIVSFTPNGGRSVLHPIVAGDSYASQSELTAHFGLGSAAAGTVEVRWPGGTRNRLYDVSSGESLRLPEIPCSYAASWSSASEYEQCVDRALQDLVRQQFLSIDLRNRLYQSAIRARASG